MYVYIYIYDMFIIIYAHVQLNAPLTYRILYILHSYIYIWDFLKVRNARWHATSPLPRN